MTAEAPIFVGQVFCFVKLKVILDTGHIFIRSFIFILIVLMNKDITIYAFGIAQITSACTIIVGNYAFYYFYIPKLLQYRKDLKKVDDKYVLRDQYGQHFENMEDFPFVSIKQMLPGVLPNPVSMFSKVAVQSLL